MTAQETALVCPAADRAARPALWESAAVGGVPRVGPGGVVGEAASELIARNDSYSVAEDLDLFVSAAGGVLANDSIPGSGSVAVVLLAGPAHGTFELNPDGSFRYSPVANFNGPDSFRYLLVGDGAVSSQALATLTVTPVNDAPVAIADVYSVLLNAVITATLGVLANDADVDGDLLSALLVAGTAHGTLALNPNGSFTYTPAAEFTGTDSFSYWASDGSLASAPATVNLNVMNGRPVTQPDAFSTAEDTVLSVPAPGVLGNDSDPGGNRLTASLVSGPAHGTLLLNGDGSFSYTPAENFNGTDGFVYEASNELLTAAATIAVAVTPSNDTPVALTDLFFALPDRSVTGDVLANDLDVDGDTLAVRMVSAPTHATVFRQDPHGSFVYLPAPDFAGIDSFSYQASDGSRTSNVTTVSLSVPQNIPIRSWTEAGDAGDAVGSAQIVVGSGALAAIQGVLANGEDADLYFIDVADPEAFSASTVGGAGFDTQLFLFGTGSMGVVANDDSAGTVRSTLPVGTLRGFAPSTYVLAISGSDRDPLSADGEIFPDTPSNVVYGPVGPGGGAPLSGFDGIGASGTYAIVLQGAAFVSPPPPAPKPDGGEHPREESALFPSSPEPLPDLVVESLEIEPATPTTLDTVTLFAVVANRGEAPSAGSNLRLELDGAVESMSGFPPLNPGARITVQRTVGFLTPGTHLARVVADPLQVVAEVDETNNEGALAVSVAVSSLATWVEQGDAGETAGAAQTVLGAGGLGAIHGALASSEDADVYVIEVTDPVAFSATTAGGAAFDTQLFLFRLDGMGVAANDDAFPLFQSTLPVGTLTAPSVGPYLLAISGFDRDPVNSRGEIFPDSAPDLVGPTGPGGGAPLSAFSGNGRSGAYTIRLAGAAFVHASLPTWAEADDAGETVEGAQTVVGSGAVGAIQGVLASADDADVYAIEVTDPVGFSAAVVGGAAFDTQLFLFRADGAGVLANDDSAGTVQSTLPVGALTGFNVGRYLLAIAGFDRDPVSAAGEIFPDAPLAGVLGPTGPGGGAPLRGFSGGGRSGPYTIRLTGAAFVEAALPTWSELGDAGETVGAAQTMVGSGALAVIEGALVSSEDADIYAIEVTDPAAFSASTVGGADFDTQIFLFRADGTGVLANDDTAGTLRSALPAGALAGSGTGRYLLAIAGSDRDPVSGGLFFRDEIFPDTPFTGVVGPTGPGGADTLSGFRGSGRPGAYSIRVTGTAFVSSPPPTTWGEAGDAGETVEAA